MTYRATWILALSGAMLAAQTSKKPSNDGWVTIPQKGTPPPAAQPAPGGEPEAAEAPAAAAPKPVPNSNDERPPRLKRGGSGAARGRNLPPASAVEIVSDAEGRVVEQKGSRVTRSGDPMIDKARRAVMEFDDKIPNFICDQVTVRYDGEGIRGTKWKKLDRLEAEVMVVDGAESYRNFRRNGKPVKEEEALESGTWSTGDFHAVQLDVLAPSTAAAFAADGNGEIGGRKAAKYSYKVRQSNSHWKIKLDGKPLAPAYRGTIWLDLETARVLRLEMEAIDLPKDYPLIMIAMHVEWGLIPVGGKGFLLPVKSGNSSCKAESAMCVRNDATYSNYRQFSAESTLLTTDSTITYEGEKKQ